MFTEFSTEEIENVHKIRNFFPILSQEINNHPFVFLDSAASAQKPEMVLDIMQEMGRHCYANIHRGLYQMSERTSAAFEAVREQVAEFLGSKDSREIVFTRNSTEAFNLLAHCFGETLSPGQAIVITELEHHANIVPWLMLRDRKNIEIRVAPITDDGDIDIEAYKKLFSDGKVALASVTHMSNVLGTLTPARQLSEIAHQAGAKICFDASQSIVHNSLNVDEIGADFLTFTGHKIYGPTGVGVLWGKYDLMQSLPPFMGGGDMIRNVSFEKATWADAPHRFEAGTPAILEVIGLGAALRFVSQNEMKDRFSFEEKLLNYATKKLEEIEGLRILGKPAKRGPVLSFLIEGAHPHDISLLLDQSGIAVRAGQHCAEPLMHRLGIQGSVRASFGAYTLPGEIDALADSLVKIRNILA
ncbi:cysteine desulfurase [Acetobacteraceae bacterium]|nr:cysteine desulfurase [Acetobacteraceae bacterium]